jgi:hypothetical protein
MYRFYMDFAQETLMVALYLAGLIVCVRNRRVSPCIQFVITGFAVLIAAAPTVQLVGLVLHWIINSDGRPSESFFYIMQFVELCQRFERVVGMSLIVFGLGLVLIDVGRRVRVHQRGSEELSRPALGLSEAVK